MALLGIAFNTNDQDASQSREPLPAGTYAAHISASSMETASTGGKFLKLEFTVTTPTFQGRKVWANLNLIHSNPIAVTIAKEELTAICEAAGFSGDLNDSSALHNKPLDIVLKVTPPRGQYDASNDITGYKKTGAPVTPGATESKGEGKKSDAGAPPWAS